MFYLLLLSFLLGTYASPLHRGILDEKPYHRHQYVTSKGSISNKTMCTKFNTVLQATQVKRRKIAFLVVIIPLISSFCHILQNKSSSYCCQYFGAFAHFLGNSRPFCRNFATFVILLVSDVCSEKCSGMYYIL